jgi:hypothetical protein
MRNGLRGCRDRQPLRVPGNPPGAAITELERDLGEGIKGEANCAAAESRINLRSFSTAKVRRSVFRNVSMRNELALGRTNFARHSYFAKCHPIANR